MIREFWTPEPLWTNKTVFVIGGGPSLKGFNFEKVRNKHVLGINEAYRDVPWAEILFFRDSEWFEGSRPDRLIPPFNGKFVTTAPKSKEDYPKLIHLLKINTLEIPRARTGGHNAVALALTMKAKKIILLGFDFNPEGGNYHDRHKNPGLKYRGGVLESWGKYRTRAEREGCEILNANPKSFINEFKKINLENVL